MEPLIPERGTIRHRLFRDMVAVITDLIVHESALLRGSEDQFTKTEKYLRELHLMLTVAGGMEGSNPTLLTLVDDMRQLVVHAEHVVEDFVLERERQSKWDCFRRTIFFFRDMIARHRFRDEVEKIRLSLLSIKSRGTLFGIRPIDSIEDIQSAALWRPSFGSLVKESNDIMGPELDYKVIKSRLMATASSAKKQSVIAIVGKGGAGKTTLAHKIYNDSEIKNHFACRAWIAVSPAFVPAIWLSEIGRQVRGRIQVTDQRTPSVSELTKSLSDFLSSKRYLIVMDDVWITEDWDILREAFPKTDKGSGIIVTTRVRKVALYTNPKSPPYELQLSDEDGWMLLNSKIYVPVELEEVGWAIVRRCMGSALMISEVGTHLLKIKATKEQWTLMLDQLKSYCTSVYDSLGDTADFLPSYLKPCLYYFGLFREDYDIPVRRLIILWVAEGLARKEESSDESPEVVAEKYLSTLIEQNMIQVVKRKPDGRVKTCRMHDVLRDVWVQKAK